MSGAEDMATEAESLTARMAAFVAGTRLADVPSEAVTLVKKSILDCLGTGLSGSAAPISGLIRRYLGELGPLAGPSRVVGTELSLTPRFAALANGTAMHADDFDDTWQSLPGGPRSKYRGRMGVHPTGPVLAAALAIADRDGGSGPAVLAACLVGIEVACKVFDATDFVDVDNAVHTTGTCALVGAAAGVANLLKHEAPAIQRLLGIACDLTSGLSNQHGTMAKPWHAGRAAESAIVALDLASLGFTASDTVLEDQGGYLQFEGGGYQEEPIRRLGDPWCFLDRGIWLKPYPTGSLSHPAMTKLMELILEHDLQAGEVEAVRVRTGEGIYRTLARHRPKDALEAKFSLEFCLATLLLERNLGLQHIDDGFVGRTDVQDLIGRVTYTAIPEAEASESAYTLVTSFVEMDCKDGRQLGGRIDYGKGSLANPMSLDEVAAKFRLCAERARWPEDKTEAMIETVARLEEVDDVRELTALLSGAA